jgi:flagellar hook assembly protein FlgD
MPDGGGEVRLSVYDATGRLVKTLVDGYQPAGARTVRWDGRNDQGQPMASGIYFYRMTAPAFSESRKMFLLR